MSYLRAHIRHLIGVPLCSLALVAPAAAVVDGSYQLMINTTPSTTSGSGTEWQVGSDGNWNSTFTVGQTYPSSPSQYGLTSGMTDNGACITGSDGICRGSGLAGDGYAGVIGMTITAGAISVTSFSVDTIFDNVHNDWAQYAPDVSGMTGSVDALGNMIFRPTGRLGAISAPATYYDLPWNIDNGSCCAGNGNTEWTHFTTGTHSGNPFGDIAGSPFVSIGDVNSDGRLDYSGILVSGGYIGSAWNTLFGAQYYETWNVTLLSQVPVPAAAWLFGSGLLGLVGLARRRA